MNTDDDDEDDLSARDVVCSIMDRLGVDESLDPEGLPRPRTSNKPNRDDSGSPLMTQAVLIARMLEQGPTYRARSWAWPVDEEHVSHATVPPAAASVNAALLATSGMRVRRWTAERVLIKAAVR